jgi:hypothetical protein
MQRFDKLMQSVDMYVGDELALYDNLTGHPKVVFPEQLEKAKGLLTPRPQSRTRRARFFMNSPGTLIDDGFR